MKKRLYLLFFLIFTSSCYFRAHPEEIVPSETVDSKLFPVIFGFKGNTGDDKYLFETASSAYTLREANIDTNVFFASGIGGAQYKSVFLQLKDTAFDSINTPVSAAFFLSCPSEPIVVLKDDDGNAYSFTNFTKPTIIDVTSISITYIGCDFIVTMHRPDDTGKTRYVKIFTLHFK